MQELDNKNMIWPWDTLKAKIKFIQILTKKGQVHTHFDCEYLKNRQSKQIMKYEVANGFSINILKLI